MTRTVVIEPEADEDLARAFAWYEQTSSGMGYVFIDAMREAVARLADAPRRQHDRIGQTCVVERWRQTWVWRSRVGQLSKA